MTEQANQKFGLTIRPNPAKTVAAIEVLSGVSCRARLYFCDPAGNQVLSVPFSQKLSPGKNLIHVNIAPLWPGSYTVCLYVMENKVATTVFEVIRIV